jgi:hypothetical protein
VADVDRLINDGAKMKARDEVHALYHYQHRTNAMSVVIVQSSVYVSVLHDAFDYGFSILADRVCIRSVTFIVMRVRMRCIWAAAAAARWAHARTPQVGNTALIRAAEWNRVDCVRLLLDAGADKEDTEEVPPSPSESARVWAFCWSGGDD